MKTLNKADGLVVRELDQETVILNTKTGYIHILNPTGTVIWKLLDELDTFDAVVDAMSKLYNHIDLATIHADVTEVIADMLEHRIICEN